jgi:DNA-binding NtrC family response regulator
MLPRILVVDDEVNMLKLLQRVLGKEGYEVRTSSNSPEAIRLLREEDYDLVICDLVMPVIGGLDLMMEVRASQPDLPFIVITAHGSIGSAVEAMRTGAFDYLTKPFRKEELLLVVRKASKYCELRREVRRLREELNAREGFREIIIKSEAMRSVFKLINQIADSQATVLIRGESGTGKEVIARAIHEISNRRAAPFVAVDCSVLPEQLLQSELFGHLKGAFTGAVSEKKGLFLAAEGGTLFLDEIGNISPTVQLNLLRVLQEKEIKPVGAVKNVKVNVRVVAATNSDLEAAMRAGAFRKDLYYRLAVVTVNLPPLQERREDIAPLAYHFMQKYAQTYNKPISDISPDALRRILENPWPGNVRELENVMERAVLLSSGRVIDPSALSLVTASAGEVTGSPGKETPVLPLKTARRQLVREEERAAILKAFREARGNRTNAAKLLGISRSSLYNKLKELGLDAPGRS